MTPSLCVDRAQYVRDQARRLLQLDVPRLTPHSAAGIYQFRAAGGWSPVPDTPDTMLPVATGNLAELCIDGLFPRAVCLVQVDAANGVIRWARDHFISLRAVEKVQRNRPKWRRSNVWASHSSLETCSADAGPGSPCAAFVRRNTRDSALFSRASDKRHPLPSTSRGTAPFNWQISITFDHHCGISRVLKLRMTARDASSWAEGLPELRKTVARSASPAHWRWAACCMGAMSARGRTGCLLRSQLGPLLRCANAHLRLGNDAIEQALMGVNETEQRELPEWLRSTPISRGQGHRLLSVRQVVGLLLQLSTSSSKIANLFSDYAVDGGMSLGGWLSFVCTEQLAPGEAGLSSAVDLNDVEMAHAQQYFEQVVSAERQACNRGLSLLDFALQLLSPRNDAVPLEHDSSVDLQQPFATYWTSCSHKYPLLRFEPWPFALADAIDLGFCFL